MANTISNNSEVWLLEQQSTKSYLFEQFYWGWLLWAVYPVLLILIAPVCMMLTLYGASLFLHIYRVWRLLTLPSAEGETDFWNSGRRLVSLFFDAHSKIWHDHEVIGFDNIPDSGPALIIFYHGAMPVDLYYLVAKCTLLKKRLIRTIGDRFLFYIPGFRIFLRAFGVQPGSVSLGVELMQQGHLLAISPGGVREAYFSDENYRLLWAKRLGFAKIAIEANVPIIPVFTQNCREVFRALPIGKGFFRWFYEKTRLPVVPLYGGFPVKLRTFIGDPILCNGSLSPEDLGLKVQRALEDLISRHQRVPGNILNALADRFISMSSMKSKVI